MSEDLIIEEFIALLNLKEKKEPFHETEEEHYIETTYMVEAFCEELIKSEKAKRISNNENTKIEKTHAISKLKLIYGSLYNHKSQSNTIEYNTNFTTTSTITIIRETYIDEDETETKTNLYVFYNPEPITPKEKYYKIKNLQNKGWYRVEVD